MATNGFSNAARTAAANQLRPTTARAYAGWAVALLIAAFLVIGMSATLYQRLLPPVERAGSATTLPQLPPAPEYPKWDVGPEPAGWWSYSDNGHCRIGSPTFAACIDSDRRAAEAAYRREHAAWQRKADAHQKKLASYETEKAEWERLSAAQAAERDRISAVARRPLLARLAERWQFWAGLVLLAGAVAAAATRTAPAPPPHRDPKGPAAAALTAEHAAGAAPLTVAGAAGATLLASLHSFGAFAIVGGVSALIAWSAVTSAKEKRIAAEGYRVADQQWQEAATAAERAGQAPPPEPQVAETEAQTLGETGGFVAPEGSAMAVMLDPAGRPGPAAAAWNRIAVALALGTADERGIFQPWAVVEAARWFDDTGDVELAFRLDDVTKTAADMTRVAGPLLRELKVRALVGGAFTTRHTDGRVVGRFTNNIEAPAAAPATAEVDDDWGV